MTLGAIDCDIHPGVPDIKALLPYMNDFWQESFVARGIDGFDMMSYPLNAPITCRPDWRVKGQRPGASLDAMRAQALARSSAASTSWIAAGAQAAVSLSTCSIVRGMPRKGMAPSRNAATAISSAALSAMQAAGPDSAAS